MLLHLTKKFWMHKWVKMIFPCWEQKEKNLFSFSFCDMFQGKAGIHLLYFFEHGNLNAYRMKPCRCSVFCIYISLVSVTILTNWRSSVSWYFRLLTLKIVNFKWNSYFSLHETLFLIVNKWIRTHVVFFLMLFPHLCSTKL